MTVIAVVAAGDVVWIFTGCGDAVMTGTTAAKDLGVVHRDRRYPDVNIVAVLTDVGG